MKQNKIANPKLQSTNNYSLFVNHEHQQPMAENHIIALAEGMERHGFLPSKPVQVWRSADGKLHIIDGHHRVKAAELLGCFVYYVEEPEEHKNLIGEENVLVKKWRNSSFVAMFADKGNKDYVTLQNYMGRGIPLNTLANLLSGSVAGRDGGYQDKQLRAGAFKVRRQDVVEWILHLFERLGDDCPNIKTNHYVSAFAVLKNVKEFDLETFIHKAKAAPRSVAKCATRDQALEVIEEVYNYRSKIEHVPLQILAREVLRKIAVEGSKLGLSRANEVLRDKRAELKKLL